MLQLNLPVYQFKIKKNEKYLTIFDSFRNKYVKLTPEEWVRQHFLQYFIDKLSYPKALIAVEQQLDVNGMKKRCDSVFYNQKKEPKIILEFKAPTIEITQAVFDQVAVYNSKLKVDYFIVSNGIKHYFCKVNVENAGYEISSYIPSFKELLNISL